MLLVTICLGILTGLFTGFICSRIQDKEKDDATLFQDHEWQDMKDQCLCPQTVKEKKKEGVANEDKVKNSEHTQQTEMTHTKGQGEIEPEDVDDDDDKQTS